MTSFKPKRVEILDGFGGGGFDRVGDGEDSRRLAIDGDKHRGLAVLLKFHRRGFERLQAVDLFVPQEIRFADHHRTTRDGAEQHRPPSPTKVFHLVENDAL
jgi:hypothetical protein